MKQPKKVVSLLLVGSMAISLLTSCRTNEEMEESSAATEESTVAIETTLDWAVYDTASITYYEQIAQAYEVKHPEVNIRLRDLSNVDYATYLELELEDKRSSIDIITLNDVLAYRDYAKRGLLEPLDNYYSEYEDLNIEDYGNIIDQIRVDDVLYELPFKKDFWVMFYNKQVFDDAKVSYPTNNMTFEQFDELARKVSKDKQIYGVYYHTWRDSICLFGLLDGEHTIVDGSYGFLKPYYELAINQQNDGICKNYSSLKKETLNYADVFAEGNVAMMNMGTWFIATLSERIKSGEYKNCSKWGIVRYPREEGNEAGNSVAMVEGLAITASSDDKQAAYDFLAFACGENGAFLLSAAGTFPGMMTDVAIDQLSEREGFPANDKTSKDALRTNNTYLDVPLDEDTEKTKKIEQVLDEQHNMIMSGSCTIDEGIEQMEEQVNEILE